MENLVLIRLEIFIFVFTFLYILYFIWDFLFSKIKKIKNNSKRKNIKENKSSLNKVTIKNEEVKKEVKQRKIEITWKELNYLNDLIKRVKLNSSKWYYDTSKWLIIEWLSIDKYNRELNIELAYIYEKEWKYRNAELIYKDLITYYKNDFTILKRLGFVLFKQDKLEESFDIYNKLHVKKMADDEVVEFLSEISFDLEKYKESLKFINAYLRNKPRDTDRLFMKAFCYEHFRDFNDAITVYKRILELQPYNTKARDKIVELENYII